MLLKKDQHLRFPIILALSAIVVGLLVYRFANIREERVVQRFLQALKAQNYPSAYQIWGPTPNYTYKDFMTDWGGAQSYYGLVKSYQILESKSRGSGVVITVEFNHLKKQLNLWVERRTQQLSFSPY
jgi:hypothetical protein